jgi:hypothetical protein
MQPLADVILATRQICGKPDTRVKFKANGMPRALRNALHFSTFCNGDPHRFEVAEQSLARLLLVF